MKALLIIGGLFMLVFVCLVPLKRDIQEYNTQKNGKLVTATITHIPICSGTKFKYFMKFTYDGQEFSKRVGCGFADNHKVGETIELRHTHGTDIFLFEKENKETEFVSTGLLAILGIASVVIGARRK